MPKEATSLFELADGAIPPSDETLRKLDAPAKDRALLASINEASDALCERMKFLSCDSRLEAARRIAKGINSATRMFNVAVFIRDREEGGGAELFDDTMHKPPTEDLF